MNLYTFIMNYLGGTYILQVTAKNEHVAMRKWLKNLNVTDIQGMTELQKDKLLMEDFADESPVLITGCKNTWCFGLKISAVKKMALVNFIKTDRYL